MSKIKFKYKKSILMILVAVIFVLPIIAAMWFLMNFNIPFINAGDKSIIYVAGLFYWISWMAFIFGFRYVNR